MPLASLLPKPWRCERFRITIHEGLAGQRQSGTPSVRARALGMADLRARSPSTTLVSVERRQQVTRDHVEDSAPRAAKCQVEKVNGEPEGRFADQRNQDGGSFARSDQKRRRRRSRPRRAAGNSSFT